MSFKSLSLSDPPPPGADSDPDSDAGLFSPPIEYRKRTLDYDKNLPYPTETPAQALEKLHLIVERLFVSVESKDLFVGTVNATIDLSVWLSLKFDLPAELHIKLFHLYYDLCLSPDINRRNARHFMNMFTRLANYRDALKPEHVRLDWRPIWKIIHTYAFENSFEQHVYTPCHITSSELPTLAMSARRFFDPAETPKILELVLPYFSIDFCPKAFAVVASLNLLLPHCAPPPNRPDLHPQKILPTIFYLWSTFAHSRLADIQFLTLLCRMATECLESPHVEFGDFGIFTEEQSTEIFTAILRSLVLTHSATHALLRSPAIVSPVVQEMLQDTRGDFTMSTISKYIVSSMSAACLRSEKSVFANLEVLIQTIKPFYHPSIQNVYLSDLIANLCVTLTWRWLDEQSGEVKVPESRRLSRDLIKRFVILLRELPLIGIFSKSHHDERRALNALEYLAFLEPTLVLPHALRLIYPALQDNSPAHRTKSCIKALSVLSRSMAKTKGFRCHIAFLLGLLLPAIDPNDPSKTRRALSFIQTVSQLVPIHNLQTDRKKRQPDYDEPPGSFLAQQWFQSEMDRFENAPEDFELDYNTELTDEQEEAILCQTTAGLEDYVREFVMKLFVLAESMCGPSGQNHNVGPDKTESALVSALSLMSLSFFPSLSPELFEVALDTVSIKIHDWSLQGSRSGVSVICHALVLADPVRTMEVLFPSFFQNIRIEVLENGAGTTRGQDDILPRDQRLVYYLRTLNSLIAAGWALKSWATELRSLFDFLLEHCRGPINRYVEALIGRFLGALSNTRPKETSVFDPEQKKKGLTPNDWGCLPSPESVKFEWYIPAPEEIQTVVDTFYDYSVASLNRLEELMGPNPPVKRDGKGKEWTDEITKILSLFMDMMEETSALVDPDYCETDCNSGSGVESCDDVTMSDDPLTTSADSPQWNSLEFFDKIVGNPDLPSIRYEYGYILERGSDVYLKFHRVRTKIGYALHRLHDFLHREAEDNFACSTLVNHVISTYLIDVAISRYMDTYRRFTDLYQTNSKRFKYNGMRKQIPRSLMIIRYQIHHLSRRIQSTMTRTRTQLDVILLNDLVTSSVFSRYRQVRIHAQHLLSFPQRIVGSSVVFVLNRLLTALEESIAKKDLRAIKGIFYTLLLPDLDTRLRHEWQLAARFVKLCLKTFDLDKTKTKLPEINQDLFSDSFSLRFESPKSLYRLTNGIFSESRLAALRTEIQKRAATTERMIGGDYETVRWDFAQSLVEMLRDNNAFTERDPLNTTASEWPMKKTSLLLSAITTNGVFFDTLVSDAIIDQVFAGLISSVPAVRQACGCVLEQVLGYLSEREISNFDHKQWQEMAVTIPGLKTIDIDPTKPGFTAEFLKNMKKRDPENFVDSEYGWLVWPKSIQVMSSNPEMRKYPELDARVRRRMGQHIDRAWVDKILLFGKVEPMAQQDKYRADLVGFYAPLLELVFTGEAKITFEELKESIATVLADKDDKNCDRARSEVMGALVQSVKSLPAVYRNQVWEYVLPFLREVIGGKARSEVLGYWFDLLEDTVLEHDPRRGQPVIDLLTDLPKEITPDGMLKRQALFDGLRRMVRLSSWYLELDSGVMDLLLAQLTNPYKAIRAIVGNILSVHVQCQHHPSFANVDALLQAQEGHPVGQNPYVPRQALRDLYAKMISQLDEWKATHLPNQTKPTDYRNGGKTVLTCFRTLVFSPYCGLVTDLLSGDLFPHLLFMVDIKEDEELVAMAADLLLSLPLLPFRDDQDVALVNNIVRVGRESTSWHHRMHVLALVSTLHYQRQFTLPEAEKDRLLESVISMLEDTQIDVRQAASKALAAMVQCMPVPKRTAVIADLQARLGKILAERIPKAKRKIEQALSPASLDGPEGRMKTLVAPKDAAGGLIPTAVADFSSANSSASSLLPPPSNLAAHTGGAGAGAASSASSSNASLPLLNTTTAPTGVKQDRPATQARETPQAAAIRKHHGAVLGLGSLVLAFPFASPPPRWMPAVLNVLAVKAMADTSVVARSAKWFLAEFRKTRQDTWFIDSKAFKGDELVNLEGVVQVSYFA